jgi:adenylate cyclase
MTLEAWIIDRGFNGATIADLLDGVATRLVDEGVPLLRAYIAFPTVNAATRVFNHSWTREGGSTVESIGHDRIDVSFERSPFFGMRQRGLRFARWRLDDPHGERFEVFDDLRRIGGTDYLAYLIPFDNPDAPAMQGMACSFCADRPEGFSEDAVARIDGLVPLIGLAAYRIGLFGMAANMLDTYVGLSAGRRVLNGEIRRGAGTTLTAALMIADLRGFTALADTAGTALIGRLDEHLEAMADPVLARGGEVLKFLGDGLLAAFPISDDRPRAWACADALAAARDALARNREVNARHWRATALDLDVALHCGEVYYGNIGAATRLDFTVIGPAVNETSRMEALCAALGCNLLMSASVAEACGAPTCSLGRHALRGLPEAREIFTISGT